MVENVAGAGGNLGAAVVARAPADGYTLEIGAMSTHAMNGSLYRQLSFDPMNDFDTVAMLAYAINVIAVSASMPVHTFPELLAYIRANPGKINYASGGIGTHNHLTLALLARTAGLDIVHVPYKGGGPAVAALVQGECQMFAGGASLLLPHAQAGKIRLIAVTEKNRTDLLPGIPSVSETLKGFEVTNWYGVFAPRGLEPARRAQLNEEINRVTALPEIAERFRGLGMVRSPCRRCSCAPCSRRTTTSGPAPSNPSALHPNDLLCPPPPAARSGCRPCTASTGAPWNGCPCAAASNARRSAAAT